MEVFKQFTARRRQQSMILVPAYIMVFVGERALSHLDASPGSGHRTRLGPFLQRLGGFAYRWLGSNGDDS